LNAESDSQATLDDLVERVKELVQQG
jgi:hypothetical protein